MEEKRKAAPPLGEAPVGSLMFHFAVPSIIAMLVGSIYNIVDQFFIGHYVGILGNSATNVAFPLTTCCLALALMFGIGGSSAFNLATGGGHWEQAPHFVGVSLTALVASGVLLSAVTLVFMTPMLQLFGAPPDVMPYARDYVAITALGFPALILTTGGGHLMRADGSPHMTMICSISGAVINVFLDALFVAVLGMGMKGAALATILGQLFSAGQVIWYFCCRFRTMPLKMEHLRPNLAMLGRVTSLGTAICFNQLTFLLVQVVMNNSLRHYGALSVYGPSVPLAAVGIVMKVNQLFFGIIIGIGQASQPIVSYNYGARKYDRVRKAFRIAVIAGAVVSVATFALFQLFPRELLGLFGDGSEAYFECGEKFFRIFLLLVFTIFTQPIISSYFTSVGKPIKGVFLSLTRQVLFLVPLMVILPLFWGFDGLLWASPLADGASCVVALVMAVREFHGMRRLEAAGAEGAEEDA